jgi:ABC-2 type transport system ATP-binding protein
LSVFYNFEIITSGIFHPYQNRRIWMNTDIQIKDLTKKYPNGTEALKGISHQISRGTFFTLLGPNGAGKSTLVKILTTLISKDGGEVRIRGMDPETEFSKIQKIIGVASQDNEIDPDETVENLLRFQGRIFGLSKQDAEKRSAELINAFQIGSEKHKKAGTLSGGNKRRLHCALSLVHDPEVLFLDEPTVGMDPVARSDFWRVITGLNKENGVTVFLTTQYLEEAEKHAEEMALIVDGTVRYTGSITDFKSRVEPENKSTLEESYLTYLKSVENKEET